MDRARSRFSCGATNLSCSPYTTSTGHVSCPILSVSWGPGNLEQPDQTTKEVFGQLLELLKCHGKTVEKGDRLALAQDVVADLDAVDLSLLHTTTNIRGVMGIRAAWQHKMLLGESAQG